MPDDLERLYDAHAPALYAFLINLTRDEAAARDLLQEVFCKLARQPDLVAAARDEHAFLLRLAHNAAIDSFRRQSTRVRNYEALGSEQGDLFAPASDPDEAEFRRQLTVAFGELPVDQRAVVHLKLWEGLTFDALAELLGIPLNTAASRYRYGLDKLRDRLRPLYDEIKHGRL